MHYTSTIQTHNFTHKMIIKVTCMITVTSKMWTHLHDPAYHIVDQFGHMFVLAHQLLAALNCCKHYSY